MKLKDKVSIITGAGRGIGEGIALRYAQEGSKVVVVDIERQGEEVVKKIIKSGGDALFVKADLSDSEDIENVVNKPLRKYGTIDILVNNAGVAVKKPIHDCTLKDWDFHLMSHLSA